MPATLREVRDMGWDGLDVVLVTGDAYIDSPHSGVAVIGRVLMDAGYRVGVVAQPDVGTGKDIQRLGEPALFWGVTSGNVDSMVANYTASGKRRKSDDMTPGGKNERRPDRAVIVYANLIRRYFKNTRPIVLGGVEASLRRVSQYDAWSDSIRRSVLFDAKADYIVYGMGEQAVVELAQALREKRGVEHIRGICYVSGDVPEPDAAFADPAVRLPDHAAVAKSKKQFGEMFKTFCQNADPATGKRLCQLQDTRFLVQNPPPLPPTSRQLDEIYELPFSRKLHPLDEKDGAVKALDTVRFSLTTHRGCFGDCRFCAIAVHQGRRVVSRTKESILREARSFLSHPDFKGIVSDAGGPTANMYGMECERKKKKGSCKDKGCLFPVVCKGLRLDHGPQIELLKALRDIEGIRKVFVGSGIRYDLIVEDRENGEAYLENLLRHHVSGQMKIAPEHVADNVLRLMGKPGRKTLEEFLAMFERMRRKTGANVFLTYYLMAAHPGCALSHMKDLRTFASRTLRLLPEQIQIFTPTPSTWSSLMYYSETDPFSGERIFVEKKAGGKQKQKDALGKKSHWGKKGKKASFQVASAAKTKRKPQKCQGDKNRGK